MGFDQAKDALADGKAKVVLLSADVSAKTEKEVNFFAAKTSVKVIKTNITMDEFAVGIGKKAGVITICDDGFSKKAVQLAAQANEE